MRGAGIVLLAICVSGCVTRALWEPRSSYRKPRPAGAADLSIERLVEDPAPRRAVAFAIEPPAKAAPRRMRKDLAAGRTWLRLKEPFSLSFAGGDLLEARTPFRRDRVSVELAQTNLEEGGVRRDPALLRLEGAIPREEIAARVERVPQPEGEPRGLDHVADRDLRVLLGHGMDTLVPITEGSMPADVFTWFGVEGPSGPGADWRAALGLAQARGSLAPLLPYRVIVRRWRAMELGGPACFRVPLADVVVASQMSVSPEGRWTWEGLWIGAVEPPAEAVTSADGLPALLRYREYKQDGKYGTTGVLWRTLLTPLALTADYGIWSIDDWLREQGQG